MTTARPNITNLLYWVLRKSNENEVLEYLDWLHSVGYTVGMYGVPEFARIVMPRRRVAFWRRTITWFHEHHYDLWSGGQRITPDGVVSIPVMRSRSPLRNDEICVIC